MKEKLKSLNYKSQKSEDSEKKYRLIVQNINDAITIFGFNGKCLYASPQFSTLIGKGEVRSVFKFIRLIHPDDFKDLMRFYTEIMKKKDILMKGEMEFRVLHDEGYYIWLSCLSNNYYNENGEVIGFITLIRDINERKKEEIEIKESRKRYREGIQENFLKNLFIHNFANILSIIKGSLDLSLIYLSKPKYQTALEEHLNIINEQVVRAKRLIINIRKLSDMEEIKPIIRPIEIMSFLKNNIDYIHRSFQQGKIDIQIESLEDKYNVYGNDLINELFENLFINAIKYNENEVVEIKVKLSEVRKYKKKYLKIEIIDNGIGIPNSRKNTIFQENQKKDKRTKGMGIGLTLVKRIIDSYNGYIWVENAIPDDYTKGSNFIVLIPLV